MIDWTDIWLAFSLVIIIEGLAYVFFPEQIQRLMKVAINVDKKKLRTVGAAALVAGLICIMGVRPFL